MERARNPTCADLIAVAHEVVRQVAEPDLKAAVLFGSVAWGDADEASDLDIMLLLDRPAGYREVTRVRLADLPGSPRPDGPLFVDFDRLSVATFDEVVGQGGWAQRVVHSIILKDTDGYYDRLRAGVSAAYFTADARAARFHRRREQVEADRAAMRQSLRGDATLAALHARLALNGAATALLELGDERVSLTHFVESVQRALVHLGHAHLYPPFLRALALDAPSDSVDRSLRAYQAFAEALRAGGDDPAIGGRLSQEDRAWVRFSYSEETFEEIAHKVATFTRAGRIPALLFYLDGLLLVPIRLNVGKVLLLRSSGAAGRISTPDFQVALADEPGLYAAWVEALRLVPPHQQAFRADELTGRLLDAGEAALRIDLPAVPAASVRRSL